MKSLGTALLLLLLASCATQHISGTEVGLRPPSEVPLEFSWRQSVSVEHARGKERSFEAVLEKGPDRLVLVGLTPLQTVLFVAEQRSDGSVRFENRTGRDIPFDPGYILRDIQRAYYPWIEGPHRDGRRVGEVGGVRVEERYEGERLRERRFGPVENPVVVEYEGADFPPRRVRIVDPNRGYVLTIRTEP